MTRAAFMTELDRLLKGVPDKERKELLADYEEHFYLATAEGKTEEDIVRALGSPKHIARELTATYHVEQAETKFSPSTILRAIFAVVSLGFFNLVFVLGPFFALIAVLVSLYVTAFSLIVVPVASLFGQAGLGAGQFWLTFFVALSCAALGVLMMVGLLYLTKWAYRLLVRYLQFNLQFIKQKGDDK
ncbi:hypothetical protein CIG75_02730 [Tumebacillus algifaecis]|uniref:DUF1700 domain-containing protein n=1 Tax=Tumebacillus algifaecis TaxID=1214604 RepID=A0A223CXC2_9BACL|nr:DUF1700 domain-containing protein [Tumebacillus algifaecis]ASS74000.1 hypothetical protein CIG75_02730 [Tumebacillus algifaecis]